MGKVNQGILGALSGSVGHVTGASVKGIPTLRSKAISVADPKTASQMVERSSFAEASTYCRENREAILEQEHFKEKKGMTIWNQMISWYRNGGRLTPVIPYPTIEIDGVTCIDCNAAGWLDGQYGNIVYKYNLENIWGLVSGDTSVAVPRGCPIPEDKNDTLRSSIVNNVDGTMNVSIWADKLLVLPPDGDASELLGYGKELNVGYIDRYPLYVKVEQTESLLSFQDAKWYYAGTSLVIEILKQEVPGFEGRVVFPTLTFYTKDGLVVGSKRDVLQLPGTTPSFKKFSFSSGSYRNNPVVGDNIQCRVFFIGGDNTKEYYSTQLVSIPSRD